MRATELLGEYCQLEHHRKMFISFVLKIMKIIYDFLSEDFQKYYKAINNHRFALLVLTDIDKYGHICV